MTRKLARIAQITDIKPIEGADVIECAIVENGWEVVVKKGEYAPNDIAIYCEIDSWIPHELAPFLTPKDREPKEYNGVKGERLRTVKLRGQISQGLLLPCDIIAPFWREAGVDVTKTLGIQKWEAPIPANLAGEIEGAFPSFIPKTDQERCQNLHNEIFIEHYDETYEVTIKLDGTSCTIFYKDGKVGVCSRNWELCETEGNTLWRCAREQNLAVALARISEDNGEEYAIQGEVIGEGIQKNQEKIKGQRFYLFDIYNITKGRYLKPQERHRIYDKLVDIYGADLGHVPIVDSAVPIAEAYKTIEDLLDYADGPSLNPQVKREGLVFKSLDSDFTFKAISNKWLLKHGE